MKSSQPYRAFFHLRMMSILTISFLVLLEGTLFLIYLPVFFAALPIVLLLLAFTIRNILQSDKQQRHILQHLAAELDSNQQTTLERFPMPIAVCAKDRTILWYNDLFHDDVADGETLIHRSFSQISAEELDDFCNRTGVQIEYRNCYFHVRAVQSADSDLYILYFENNSNLIRIVKEYNLSRPSVLLLMIDNYEEIFNGKKESQKSTILGEIDANIEQFIGKTSGFFKRLTQDRFLAIVEQRHLEQMIAQRFPIIQNVRKITQDERIPITLSIGVGSAAESLAESEFFARQALDMALGRGGDQAAVKTVSGFAFYGGVSPGIEKRTKVKTRAIATALVEFIHQSDFVVVMGHRFGDLDSLGTSIGMAATIQKLGKRCLIAVDQNKNLATPLLNRYQETHNQKLFQHPSQILEQVTPQTLLIIVDAHNPDFLESPALYQQCEQVVIIDHHRRMVRKLKPILIFFHEPYASSASEMVTELIQYMGNFQLSALEAEALLAGIMLDTKNFVIKAGVRTFEASAYLKQLGADTVAVRKLFSTTIDTYQKKTRIVSSAESYQRCAIAIGDFESDDMRVIASQAADELLSISDIDASFVLYLTGSTTNISARSLGEINAQVIMEELGGGGHQTMAACQLENTSFEKARQLLLEAIDRYFDHQTETKSKPSIGGKE